MPRFVTFFMSAVATVATLALSQGVAKAEPALGFDLDLGVPANQKVGLGTGFGFRLGNQIQLEDVEITPEVDFAYLDFGGAYGPRLYRAMAGARVGFGDIIRPGAYTHLGLGRYEPTLTIEQSQWTWEFDAGAFLDVIPDPVFSFGAHAAYNHSSGVDYKRREYDFYTLGMHATFAFY
jgi:hypothetical protein